ncbi:DUF3124 domain-containing protein [Psychrobacter sp. HD31]|uniref:DUF3124 domain-containing protein n=1 Tax=Psychrobacter sp. HD31 TaxID=3112003 RepID=UPI003DA3835E
MELSNIIKSINLNKLMLCNLLCATWFGLSSCTPATQPEESPQHTDNNHTKSQNRGVVSVPVMDSSETENMAYQQSFYVPIYSDIYLSEQNPKILMTAVLSIRNTSQSNALFIKNIDYFNTEGKLVKQVLNQTIKIMPMGTYNFNLQKQDDTGGSGANFLITTGAKKNIQPIIQAVMIGNYGNKAFAFSVDGVELSQP